MQRRFRAKSLRSLGWVICALFSACGGDRRDTGLEPVVNPGQPEVVTVTPEDTGDGWRVSTPEAEGMDGNMLLAGLQAIRNGDYPKVDSVVIVKNNAVIAEGYFNGFSRDSLHDLRSASKSVTSALTGIAVSQGLFAIDDPIASSYRTSTVTRIWTTASARSRSVTCST